MEELTKDIPEPGSKSVTITAFVDASHASYKRTRLSHIGYVIFENRVPIIFYSKPHSTIESSTFQVHLYPFKKCT